VRRPRAPTAMKTTPITAITMSGDESTELHTMARAAPTAMTIPTTNMTVLFDMDPVWAMSPQSLECRKSHSVAAHIGAHMR